MRLITVGNELVIFGGWWSELLEYNVSRDVSIDTEGTETVRTGILLFLGDVLADTDKTMKYYFRHVTESTGL